MFVGGEFYYDTRWFVEKPVVSTDKMTFLNGGKACLIVIADYLLDHGINRILLPSYLCSTIVSTLERCGLNCDYYQVNPDFSIDLENLDQKIASHQAIYFINYFGFFHSASVQDHLASFRQKGILLAEDNAQAGFTEHTIGDFIFNSMRKLCAYDAGYLATSFVMSPYVNKYQGRTNRHLPVTREYRSRLGDYLFRGSDIYAELQKLYTLAEEYYESDLVVEGDPQERMQIELLDWQAIKRIRRENYAYLMELISGISELSPIFPALQEDNSPLGLPVYVNGISRDWLFDELGNSGIGLTIHWDELLRDPRLNHNPVAVDMASRILTLPIDQRTSYKQMDYLVQNLVALIRKGNPIPGQK